MVVDFIILLAVFCLIILYIIGIALNEIQENNKRKKCYRNLLNDDRWKDKRKEILERDNHRCCWCGSSENLQVHHKYYEKYPNGSFVDPWDYPNNALITLCKGCHEKAHKYDIKVYRRQSGKKYYK